MEVVSGDRVAEGMKYLQWDIENEREKGVKKKEENVWSRFKNMEEKYFAMKISELVTNNRIHPDPDHKLVDKFLNVLSNFDRSPLIFSRKSVEDGKYIVVAGAGKIFKGLAGVGSLKASVRAAILLWIKEFIYICEREGASSVCKEWIEEEETGKGCAGREMFIKEREKSREATADPIFISVDDSVIKPEVLACFRTLSNVSGQMQIYMLIRRRAGTRVSCGKKKKKNYNDNKDGAKLISLLSELKYTCLVENNQVAAKIMVYKDEHEWQKDQEKAIRRMWEGVEIWPFVSVDSEGKGAWFQIGYYGSGGWECVLFCAFLPEEVMAVLESSRTILIGVDIHAELGWILGTQAGWRGLDLGIWTRDLYFHDHNEYGLKKLIEMSVGFDTKKLKLKRKNMDSTDKVNKEMFGYIRAGNWGRKNPDSRQLVYMTSDVTLAGTIVFDIIVVLVMELGLDVLDNKYKNLEEFVTPYIMRILDRKFDRLFQHSSNCVPVESRSIAENSAALKLSLKITDEGSGSRECETIEERRRRLAKQIKETGQQKLDMGEKKLSEWQKVPSERSGAGKRFKESTAEESWD